MFFYRIFLFICFESKDLFKEYLIVEKMEPEETLEELAERDWYGWLKVEITANLMELKRPF